MALTPAQMTTNLQTHLRAAGTEDIKRYTMRPPGWEGQRAIRRTVRPWAFLWGTWGDSPQPSHTHRHIGLTASAAVAGVKRSRQTAFIEKDLLQTVRKVCTFAHSVCTGLSKPDLPGVKVLYKFGYHKDDKKSEGRMLTRGE